MLNSVLAQIKKQFLPLTWQTSVRKNVVQKFESQSAANPDANDPERNSNILNIEDIKAVVRLTPTLQSVPTEVWQRMYNTFLNHGLSTQSFLRIIARNPKILMRPTNKISNTLEYWRSCQFGEFFLFTLLTKYPELMDLNDHRKLIKRINFLQSYVSTSKNTWRLLINSPFIILEQPEKDLAEKFDYFKNVMRLDIPEIVKSQSLALTLDEIKCRHIFLERLGLFKPRSIRANPDEPTKNPRLYKITDTSEKTFATKVCHVPLEEYECFKTLFQRELRKIDKCDAMVDSDDEYSDGEMN